MHYINITVRNKVAVNPETHVYTPEQYAAGWEAMQ